MKDYLFITCTADLDLLWIFSLFKRKVFLWSYLYVPLKNKLVLFERLLHEVLWLYPTSEKLSTCLVMRHFADQTLIASGSTLLWCVAVTTGMSQENISHTVQRVTCIMKNLIYFRSCVVVYSLKAKESLSQSCSKSHITLSVSKSY